MIEWPNECCCTWANGRGVILCSTESDEMNVTYSPTVNVHKEEQPRQGGPQYARAREVQLCSGTNSLRRQDTSRSRIPRHDHWNCRRDGEETFVGRAKAQRSSGKPRRQ